MFLKMNRAHQIVAIAVLLGSLLGAFGADTAEREKTLPEGGLIGRIRREEEAKRKQVGPDGTRAIPDIDVAQRELEGLNNTLSNAMRVAEQTKRAEEASGGVFAKVVIAAGILGAGVLLFGKFGPKIRFLYDVSGDEAYARANNFAEEKSLSEFVAAFKVGPTPDRRYSAVVGSVSDEALDLRESRLTAPGPLEVFFDSAPISVALMRGLIQETTRATDTEGRQRLLAQLCERIGDFKTMAGRPGVLSVWQLATALEGLVRQLAEKDQNVTPSTLRTVASAVDLLEGLSVPGIESDLISNPPLRLLAVDDDALSRHAVSFALKKALNKPDLAENGEAAMALVSQIRYDAIFLDVQMPGMDGFETCTKIHGTELNRATPVVFVTCQSDFDARAKSTLSGGNDLIGKPFLTFEITVKALTLAFRGRLNQQYEIVPRSEPARPADIKITFREPQVTDSNSSGLPPALSSNGEEGEHRVAQVQDHDTTVEAFHESSRHNEATTSPPAEESETLRPVHAPHVAAESNDSPDVVVKAFLTHALGHVRTLRIRFEHVGTAGKEERQERLVDLYLAVHSFRAEAELAKFNPVVRLGSAVEGRLKKLIEDAQDCGSKLEPVGQALDLLGYIFASRNGANVAQEPVTQILSISEDVQALLAEVASRLNPDQQQGATAIPDASSVVDFVAAGK